MQLPLNKVLRAEELTMAQFQQENNERLTPNKSAYEKEVGAAPADIDFCEAQTSTPIVYKPTKAFDTGTSIVELYRADGALMKIHICTDRFSELLSAFFGKK